MAAGAETGGGPNAVYARLDRRNRFVATLRLVVPAAALLLVGGLLVQLVLVNATRDFTVGRISIDTNRISVEAPSYTGRLSDGGTFRITSTQANAALDLPGVIDLSEAEFVITRQDGSGFVASNALSRLNVDAQTVDVPGTTDVVQSDGTTARVGAMHLDFLGQSVTAQGPVSIELAGGARIEAAAMTYDAAAALWRFERATVTLTRTPGEGQ